MQSLINMGCNNRFRQFYASVAVATLLSAASCKDDNASSTLVADGVLPAAVDAKPYDGPTAEKKDAAARLDGVQADAEAVVEEPFCITDWPSGPVNETPDEYLGPNAPTLKVLRSFDTLPTDTAVFLTKTGKNLAYTDARIFGVDVASGKAFLMPGGGYSNPPVGDDNGNIYGVTNAGAKGFKFGTKGLELHWQGPEWGNNSFDEFRKASDFARSPDGRLFAMSWNGTLFGINALTGGVVWKTLIREGPRPAGVNFGVGNSLFTWYKITEVSSNSVVYDNRTGERKGTLNPKESEFRPWLPLRQKALVAGRTVLGRINELRGYDECGNRIWSRQEPDNVVQLPLVFSSDRLIELDQIGKQVTFIEGRTGATAKVLQLDPPPTFRIWGQFEGSDGLLYFLTCDREEKAAPQLTVFNKDYNQLGNIELRRDGAPLNCPDSTMVFTAKNQIALLSRDPIRSMAAITIVQVPSPAMASSAWPTFRGDETANRWLK